MLSYFPNQCWPKYHWYLFALLGRRGEPYSIISRLAQNTKLLLKQTHPESFFASQPWINTVSYPGILFIVLGYKPIVQISTMCLQFEVVKNTICWQYHWEDFVYAPSQWETTLHCNVVSHWLGAHTNDPCIDINVRMGSGLLSSRVRGCTRLFHDPKHSLQKYSTTDVQPIGFSMSLQGLTDSFIDVYLHFLLEGLHRERGIKV